jgi:hypothetical protein
MAWIRPYGVKTSDAGRGVHYRVLFRHRGQEMHAGSFDEIDLALAEKARLERAKRDGRLDEYVAGLLEVPDADLTLWDFMRLWFTEDAALHLAEATLTNYLQVANKWIRPIAGMWPLGAFEKPRAVNELLKHAQQQGVPRLDTTGRPTGEVDTARSPAADRIRKIPVVCLDVGRRASRRPDRGERLQTSHDAPASPLGAPAARIAV